MSDNLRSLIFDPSTPSLAVLDQRKLPNVTEFIDVVTAEDAHSVIKEMNVRGAPLIAVVGVCALAVECGNGTCRNEDELFKKSEFLRTSRPTAVNLGNMLDELKENVTGTTDLAKSVLEFAEAMIHADKRTNEKLGGFGLRALHEWYGTEKDCFSLVTICNTGSLATTGHGTALGVVRSVKAAGKLRSLLIPETRPYMQGSRLTAFEAVVDGLESKLCVDSAIASYVAGNGMDAAFVGADRVVANGDTANKIGTLQLALTCKHFNIPFFVCCPFTTFDTKLENGGSIVIEERSADELCSVANAPVAIKTYNPAFDVTPSELIAGIITERGIVWKSADGSFDIEGFVKSNGAQGCGVAPRLMGGPLTTDTVAAYVAKRIPDLVGDIVATEIHGGNLNYAFHCASAKRDVFVKQAPEFIKCLGPDAKLHSDRLLLEMRCYKEWGDRTARVEKFLPTIFDVDEECCACTMEWLGDCDLLETVLVTAPDTITGDVANGLGEFLACTHNATHVSKIPFSKSAELMVAFRNEALRGVQLEYVFGKFITEEAGDAGKVFREDEMFVRGVEQMKSKYRGEEDHNLALCHGDAHPGSFFVNNASSRVVAFDPEFAIYGPPGLDLGSLLSGAVLAAVHFSFVEGIEGEGEKGKEVISLIPFVRRICSQYRASTELDGALVDLIFSDACGFAACEVGRTALGFAGGRKWLQFEEGKKRDAAKAKACKVAQMLMNSRADGIAALLKALEEL